MIGRVVAPPSFPAIVGPGSSDGTEHISSQNPSADFLDATRCELVIRSCRATILAEHLVKGAGGENPLVQCATADSERIVEVLVRPGTVAIKRYCKAVNAKLWHRIFLRQETKDDESAAGLRQADTPASPQEVYEHML
jgi:hypothetical protein